MPRWPVDIPRATPHGKWGYVRTKGQGSCGTRPYPCVHNGLDLAGPDGTEVYAPEDCSVHAVATGNLPPFTGYGPGVIVMRGKVTGVYHLLAHLQRDTIPSPTVPGGFWDWATKPHWIWEGTEERRQFREGELVGRISSANHVHWETREPGWNGARNNPALWVKRYVDPGVDVSAYSVAGGAGGGELLALLALLYLASES